MNGDSRRVSALVERALAAGGPDLAVFGHMRIESAGRVRDLLLGSRSVVERRSVRADRDDAQRLRTAKAGRARSCLKK